MRTNKKQAFISYLFITSLFIYLYFVLLFIYLFIYLLCFIIDLTQRFAFSSLQIIPQLKKMRAIMATKPLMVADRMPAELVVMTVPHEVLEVC